MISLVKCPINSEEAVYISLIGKEDSIRIGLNSTECLRPNIDFFYLEDERTRTESKIDVTSVYRESLKKHSILEDDYDFSDLRCDDIKNSNLDDPRLFTFWVRRKSLGRKLIKNYLAVVLIDSEVSSAIFDLSTGYVDEWSPYSLIDQGEEFIAGRVRFSFLAKDYWKGYANKIIISPHSRGFSASSTTREALIRTLSHSVPHEYKLGYSQICLSSPRRVGDFDPLTL